MTTDANINVCLITYNQEKYIERAIKSVLMQQCNFRFEIIISDDCSTDNTRSIIDHYADKYPNLIKAYCAKANLGMLRNWEKALKLCKAQYIALLEGDDYWNDPLKLQKQFNVLEKHPDYVISFTNASIEYESGENGYSRYVDKAGDLFTTKDLLEYNFIPTCSVLMRNHISDSFFPKIYFKSPFADWIIHILNSRYGKIHFLNEFTCTYVVHSQGVWGGIKKEKQLLNKLKALQCISEILTAPEFQVAIEPARRKALQNLCLHYREARNLSQYFKYRLKLLFA
jgi:glycosyltransferase involved in cell wall biosynthesis